MKLKYIIFLNIALIFTLTSVWGMEMPEGVDPKKAYQAAFVKHLEKQQFSEMLGVYTTMTPHFQPECPDFQQYTRITAVAALSLNNVEKTEELQKMMAEHPTLENQLISCLLDSVLEKNADHFVTKISNIQAEINRLTCEKRKFFDQKTAWIIGWIDQINVRRLIREALNNP